MSAGAVVHPPLFPHDLSEKPKLRGEKLVYDLLQDALDPSWHVFYDWAVRGTRRRVDFLCISASRGVIAFEVKGGLVHNVRGQFRQLLNARTRQRKVIAPFNQVKQAFLECIHNCGIEARSLPPSHFAIFYPEMSQSGFTFVSSSHIFTREDLAPDHFRQKLSQGLSSLAPKNVDTLNKFIEALEDQRNSRRFRPR